MVGATNRIDAFTAAPDALIRVYLDEQARAAADEAASDVGDLQLRCPGREARAIYGVFEGLAENQDRVTRQGADAGHPALSQKGSPRVSLLHRNTPLPGPRFQQLFDLLSGHRQFGDVLFQPAGEVALDL